MADRIGKAQNMSQPHGIEKQHMLQQAMFGLNGIAPLVRLDAEESAALKEAVVGVAGEVWLFGSRVDLSRRGGDVDILVLTDQPALETSRAIATRFFSRCEEKIDVIVFDPAHLSPEQSDFLTRISKVRIA